MIVCFVLIFAQVWLELKMPDYMSEITVLVQSDGSNMRDILINEVPLIFRKDIYALACVFGGIVYYLCMQTTLSVPMTQFIAALSVFLMRIISVKYHISVPVLKGDSHYIDKKSIL